MTDRIKPALASTPECPGLDALLAPLRDSGIQRHIVACCHCRTELALFKAFESDLPRPEEQTEVQWIESELRARAAAAPLAASTPAWKRPIAWLRSALAPARYRTFAMAAAALLVLVTTGVYLRQPGRVPGPAPSDGLVWRSGRFAAIAPSGELAETPLALRWEAASGAESYRVQLMQVDRTILWSADTKQTALELPEEIRTQLKPGRAFQWRVLARNPAGEEIASTDLQSFHIVVTTP